MIPRHGQRGPVGIAGGRGVIMPAKKAKDIRYTLKRLWHFFRNEKKQLLIAFLFIMVSGLLGLLVPYFIGKAIDAIFPGKYLVEFQKLRHIMLILLSIYIVDNMLTFLQEYLVAGIAQRVVFTLRENLFQKLQSLPIMFFDTHTHGEIMSRLSNDIDNVSTTISQSIIQFMASSVSILGSLAMMIYLSPLMTAASMITVPMVYFLTRFIAKKLSFYLESSKKP